MNVCVLEKLVSPLILGLDKPNGLTHVYKKTLALTRRCLTDKPSLLDSLLQEVCQQIDPVEENLLRANSRFYHVYGRSHDRPLPFTELSPLT